MAYSGQAQIAFQTGFNDALFGRDRANPYDQATVGKSYAAYEDGYDQGLLSDTPPRGPQGEQGEQGDPGPAGPAGADGTDGADGNQILVGNGAPGAGLGNNGDQYIDADNGDIYTKVAGVWNLQGNTREVPLTSRSDTIDPDAFPQITYKGTAIPGSAENASVWRIERLTLQTDGDTEIVFADGNDNFDNRWDQRLSLSYS